MSIDAGDRGPETDKRLRAILARAKTIAIVGASANPMRPSHSVMGFLQSVGFRTIPVNPGLSGQTLLGEPCFAALSDVPVPIDIVDIFRNSAEAGRTVDEAIAVHAGCAWMQIGVRDDAAASRAEAAGMDVVMDRCTKIDWGRLIGGGS